MSWWRKSKWIGPAAHGDGVDAFDADVLIYAAVAGHPLGRRVRALFRLGSTSEPGTPVGIGSVLLLPELMSKAIRDGATDASTAELAAALGATHRLRAVDAVHLATAVAAGADRLITNNRRDFPKSISEIDITYPTDLPDPDERM